MLVKSMKYINHIQDLQETFNVLRKYQMKLNPEICIFGVKSRNFLGFMITNRGKEVNLKKIQAIER